MKNTKGITRRDFLKGAAASAAGLAAAGLLGGCAAQSQNEPESPSTPTPEIPAADWRTAPAPVADSEIKETYDADVIIVGLGHAGIAASRAAIEKGVSVITLEKQDEDIFSVLGNDIGHLNSQWLKNHGVAEVDPVEAMQDWQMRSLYRCNAPLVMKFLQKSGSAFDWYIEPFSPDDINTIRVSNMPYPTHYDFSGTCGGQKFWPVTAQFSGRYFDGNFSLIDAAKKERDYAVGMGLTIHYSTSGYQLIKDDTGRVTGVIAINKDGNYVRYNAAKGVILAAGDFGADAQMVNELCPELVDTNALHNTEATISMGRDGSGIKMAVWAGAQLEPRPLPAMGGIEFKPAPAGPAGILWLDKNYKRYTTEAVGDGVYSVQSARKSGKITSVFDSHYMEYLQYFPAAHGSIFLNHESLAADDGATVQAALDAAVAAGKEGYVVENFILGSGTLYAANTMEELAEDLKLEGAEKETFLASVDRYNELCAKGVDEDLGKESRYLFSVQDAPFFAIQSEVTGGHALVTVGGIMATENQQALNHDLDPIDGLFVTGNCCGERWGFQYFTPIPGVSIGMAITLGREVGDYVASL